MLDQLTFLQPNLVDNAVAARDTAPEIFAMSASKGLV